MRGIFCKNFRLGWALTRSDTKIISGVALVALVCVNTRPLAAGTLEFSQSVDFSSGLIVNGTRGTYAFSASQGVGGGGGLTVSAGSVNDYAVNKKESYSTTDGSNLRASLMWYYDSSRRNPFAGGDGVLLGFTYTSTMWYFNSNIYPFIGVNLKTFSNGNVGLFLHNGNTSRQSSVNNGVLPSGRWYRTDFEGRLVGGQWSQVDTITSTWDCGSDGLATPAAVSFMSASFQASSEPVFTKSRWWGVFGAEGDSGIAYVDNFSISAEFAAPSIFINVASGTQTQSQAGYALLTGTLPVLKSGTGMLILDTANTLTGSIDVQQGILAVTGTNSIASSPLLNLASGVRLDVSRLPSGYTVSSGQTIAGSGTVLGSVTFGRGSTLSPGMFSAASGASMSAAHMQAGSLQALVVPEPATLGMVGVALGFVGLRAARRRRAG